MNNGFRNLLVAASIVGGPLAALSSCSSDRATPPVAAGGNGADAGSTASGGAPGTGGSAGLGGASEVGGSPGNGGAAGGAGTQSGGAAGMDASASGGSAGDADSGVADILQEPCTSDASVDPLNCGACGNACPAPSGATASCKQGKCGYDIDVNSQARWRRSTNDGPYLTLFRDGKLLVSRDDAATLLDATLSDPTSTTFPSGGGRPSIAIPVDISKPEVAITHWGSFVGHTKDGTELWSNSIHGCCGYGGAYAIDPILRRLFVGHDITELSTDDGSTVAFNTKWVDSQSGLFVSAGSLYGFYYDGAMVRWSRSDGSKLYSVGISVDASTPDSQHHCALSADETFICAIPNYEKVIAVRKNGAKAWERDMATGAFPVITATGRMVIGIKQPSPGLRAIDIATGADAWSLQTDDEVVDLLVGADGILYVAQTAVSGVIGVDSEAGFIRYRFENVGYPKEMLLRSGTIYASTTGSVVAFQVPSASYDKASPWPVRYHDNQRSRSLLMSLEY